jgi:pyridoxal 5-phosphate dependent beta-lyase
MVGMTSPAVQEWVRNRLPASVTHLDAAAAGRVSQAALAAQLEHLRQEAAVGGYVAEAAAEPALHDGRRALARFVGLGPTDVAFSDGAGTSFAVLLAAWPLPDGARIGTVGSEYGGNARVLRALAAARGWRLVPLPTDAVGHVTDLPDGLDLVTFPHVPSQLGVAQPVEQVRDSGVPLLLDVAQSLGQTPVPAGCAAYVGTSRKWLCGPRGVGFAVVSPTWQQQLSEPPTLAPAMVSGVRRWESLEAHVAGRLGLAVAAQEWTPELSDVVAGLAAHARRVLDGIGGWTVLEPADEPTGITTLRPPAGVDPVQVRGALLHEGFVVSAVPTSRADDMTTPVLRVSTPAWVTAGDLDALADALLRRTK